ncbi:helix-turn-helix transcriptional regulator [Yersinia kristensenii]|uniref:AraC family transcriptional regulator n=1 Tax=Yersinia kristensenii TaxID=28152 RepID=UPI000B71E81B|nr:helix-turn-helix transcriptional regulator [Yersinia kristensenii]MBW5810666.1 helix-turn-helix transcriptional regulator [Yersinia kristensenii]MBW5815725.1 helix-turn-helix transcriptional regulator [Yersinia kristensenii]MBW5823740.1 helix-turn-helix transcriptional regulator [Yersinia kristensenii]MBW5827903.1 helix-turn-helix transcriptional regulator [Yersinia kristensenii]MBW5840623.1 helix-turn-helix transcriptional regulator [Yersinia kristensenii]
MTKPNFPMVTTSAPQNLSFRCEIYNAHTEFLPHTHSYGQLICVKSGVLAMSIGGQRFLAPPEFSVWIPAGVEHSSYNRKPMHFRAIDIALELCDGLPPSACLINVSPIFNAIVENCFSRGVLMPESEPDMRLGCVLIDQLKVSPVQCTYLPTSQDKLLSPILTALERCPSDNTSLALWAKRVYTTERTLSRRCQQELGMAFSEWRQRLRFLHAISLLEQGLTVQSVALDVGYSSASAFIAMFQQVSGTTPERFRRDNSGL